VALAKISEANIHFAEKDKDRDIAVTDSVYDYHLDKDVEKRKRLITGQSEYDIERHQYD
jgi:hypothetical protein